MNKKTIKEFFTPPTGYFLLGFVIMVVLTIILLFLGGEALLKILMIFLGFPAILFGPEFDASVVILSIIWIFAVFYFFSCLFIYIYQKIARKRINKNAGKKNFGYEILKNVFWLIIPTVLIFTTLFMSVSGPPRRARNTRIKTALAQLRTVMVYTFGNDGSYDNFNCNLDESSTPLCKDADKNYGDIDGKEPTIVKNNISSSTAACIYSPLNANPTSGWVESLKRKINGVPQRWYCVDSRGWAGETKIDPGSTGYCVNGVSAKCPPIID